MENYDDKKRNKMNMVIERSSSWGLQTKFPTTKFIIKAVVKFVICVYRYNVYGTYILPIFYSFSDGFPISHLLVAKYSHESFQTINLIDL